MACFTRPTGLPPQPGVGLGEELPDLRMIQQSVDLLERSPVIPVAEGVLDVLEGAGERGVVQDFGQVVGDGLEDLPAAADVGVGEAPLEPLAEGARGEVRLLEELAGGGLARGL